MRYQLDFLCGGFIFPETPRWHRGSFYCCSIDEGTVFRIGEDGSKEVVLKIDDWLSEWSFLGKASEDTIVTSAKKRKLLIWDGNQLKEFADLSSNTSFSINDLIYTDNGDCFVGTVDFPFGAVDPAKAPKSPLAKVDAHGNTSVAASEVWFPNGMVIPPDGESLIVADSLESCLHRYYLAADGAISNHSIFATTPNSVPDGICRDAEGAIWVTSKNRVYRVLEGGEITDEVDMGSTAATACMLLTLLHK